MLVMQLLQFGTVDNNIVLGSIFLIGVWVSAYLLRIVYWMSDDTQWMPSFMHRHFPHLSLFSASFTLPASLTILVYGQRVLKALAFLYLALSCALFTRLQTPMSLEPDVFWSMDSLSKSYWCLIRLLMAGVVALLANVMNSHYAFRLIACLAASPMFVIDCLSEMGLVTELACVKDVTCAAQNADVVQLSDSDELTWLVWRDCASASVGIILAGFTSWQTAMWGYASNTVRIPNSEHREWMAQLNKGRLRLRKKAEEAQKQLEVKSKEAVTNLFF